MSKKFKVPLDILVKVNGIKDATRLKEGTKLVIPGYHIMEKGETLYGIAKNYDVSADLLISFNAISDPTKVKTGDRIYIPLYTHTKNRINVVSVQAKDKAGTVSTHNGLLWPIKGTREKLRGKIRGILIKSRPGTSVLSVSSGVVIWSSPYRGYGRVVFIESGNGYIYGYLGNSEIYVKVGDEIAIGTTLGKLGINAHDNTAQLIFMVYKNGRPVDPYKAPRI
ncbi:MAG: peptidoglycan DD-metalloendopeptidase family protein [Spirochaetes bacterium]|nr:peptidoglycan DD-metalloendopeptidase family protein [Spirochaetota bacterium]